MSIETLLSYGQNFNDLDWYADSTEFHRFLRLHGEHMHQVPCCREKKPSMLLSTAAIVKMISVDGSANSFSRHEKCTNK